MLKLPNDEAEDVLVQRKMDFLSNYSLSELFISSPRHMRISLDNTSIINRCITPVKQSQNRDAIQTLDFRLFYIVLTRKGYF